MRRRIPSLIVLAAVTVALAGCGAAAPTADPPTADPPTADPAAATPSPAPVAPAQALSTEPATRTGSSSPRAAPAAGDDVAACRDGNCVVRVRAGTEIPVDPRFEVESVKITSVDDDSARIVIDTGIGSVSSSGVGSSSTYNDLTVRVLAVAGGLATIALESS